MLQYIRKPSGNITVAMLLMVIAMMSGFTLSSLAMRDVMAFQYDFENLQTMLFLRSEAYRGQKIAQKMGSVIIPVRTTERAVEIVNSAMKKTFKMQSVLQKGTTLDTLEDIVVGDQKQMTEVRSLVRSKTGIGQVAFANPKHSIIRKYGVLTLESETFAKFMYFSDTDASMHGNPVYFWGPDMLYGRVHSNTDIRIKQGGGGDNNGWPIFHGWVTTNGVVLSTPAGYNVNEVFPGGLTENYGHVVFPDQANRIRNTGNYVGPSDLDRERIMLVEVNGSSYTAQMGDPTDWVRSFSDVYIPYPPPNPANLQYRNIYMIRDTVWTMAGNGNSGNRSQFVNSKLWLKGTFGSYQTWGCADTLFLIGDILLSGTSRGTNPAGNSSDVVGLVSEKSIVVKYAYRSPVDSLRIHTNMGPDTGFGGIWIYAAMAALGDGRGVNWKDGVFTFEYQHPHPSVPNFRIGNTVYKWIDLHRRRFPQSVPWPPLIDFPWYNPIWPERVPYLERGYISIYGSVSQRRRGFVHRSYLDAEWPSGGLWNQPNDFCGGSSAPGLVAHTDPVLGIPLTNVNYPGASGIGTGYKKNYFYDSRFYKTSPIDFPEVTRKDETPFAALNWVIKRPPESL
ncbi:MAG: hypothetical protein Q8J62_04110 [Candidatus Cloacimonadaceae bacterium]|nr:hypothetical protein [Candidatus Cloacimonadaceae bacterium]